MNAKTVNCNVLKGINDVPLLNYLWIVCDDLNNERETLIVFVYIKADLSPFYIYPNAPVNHECPSLAKAYSYTWPSTNIPAESMNLIEHI